MPFTPVLTNQSHTLSRDNDGYRVVFFPFFFLSSVSSPAVSLTLVSGRETVFYIYSLIFILFFLALFLSDILLTLICFHVQLHSAFILNPPFNLLTLVFSSSSHHSPVSLLIITPLTWLPLSLNIISFPCKFTFALPLSSMTPFLFPACFTDLHIFYYLFFSFLCQPFIFVSHLTV